MSERILVAMSGGVDSAVTAALLKEQGFTVLGVTMRVWGDNDDTAPENKRPCCSLTDVQDARTVAARIDIPFHVLDVREAFDRAVIAPFVHEYLRGRTPNPCVACNEHLKLGLLLEKAHTFDCAAVATGHYVRVERASAGRWGLRRGLDPYKEQSYYLFRLRQEQLAHFRAPLGALTKAEVRRLAERFGLHLAEKPGSQEICFIPDLDYRGFVRRRVQAAQEAADPAGASAPSPLAPGDIVDRHGRVLGRHDGLAGYTIGQRRGLRIAHHAPLYVVGLDPERNRVIVGEKEEVFATGLIAGEVNWLALERPALPFRARVQIRYRHAAAPARVEPLDDGRVRIAFDAPESAVTPGQAAVFYDMDNDWLLGGGWIDAAL